MDERVRSLQRLDQLLDVHRLGEEQIPEAARRTTNGERRGATQAATAVSQSGSESISISAQSASHSACGQPSAVRIGRLAVRSMC